MKVFGSNAGGKEVALHLKQLNERYPYLSSETKLSKVDAICLRCKFSTPD